MRAFLDIVFLQTTLLISCIVWVKIIKILSSCWWCFELATSAIKPGVFNQCSLCQTQQKKLVANIMIKPNNSISLKIHTITCLSFC